MNEQQKVSSTFLQHVALCDVCCVTALRESQTTTQTSRHVVRREATSFLIISRSLCSFSEIVPLGQGWWAKNDELGWESLVVLKQKQKMLVNALHSSVPPTPSTNNLQRTRLPKDKSKKSIMSAAAGVVGTKLYMAASANDLVAIARLLKQGAKHSTNHERKSPLYIAAQKGHAEACLLLLDAKDDHHVADDAGRTPLFVAAERGHEEVCALLLKRGAWARQPNCNGWTPLHIAARNGHRDVCSLLLNMENWRISRNDQTHEGCFTPLFMAAERGFTKVCELLLDHGAAHIPDNLGRTPVFVAAQIRWVTRRCADCY